MKFRKLAAAILFTAALMIPTTFGIPLTFMAFSSVGVQEAEARTRQSGAWLRQMRISHGRVFMSQEGPRVTGRSTVADWRTNFIIVPANRSRITMTAIRENNSNRAQVRFRINNGSWTSWNRSNASRRVNIPANNGTTDRQVRVRVQVRSEDGRRTTTYNYIIRRASTNTRANRLTTDRGQLVPAFNPNTTRYTINLGWGEAWTSEMVTLNLRAAHPRANTSWDRLSMTRSNPFHWTFQSIPRNNSWQTRRTSTATAHVGFGESVRVRFRILGAYNTMAAGANRTRIYTVTINRGPTSLQQILNRYEPRIRNAATVADVEWHRSAARAAIASFSSNRAAVTTDQELAARRQIDAVADARIATGIPIR